MGPLIPYIDVSPLVIPYLAPLLSKLPIIGSHIDLNHPPSIKPFGALVALGVYLGSVIAMRHAKQRGIDEKKMSEFIFWSIGGGFIGGHMLDAIFYHPAHLIRDPLYIFYLWDGLSSYGGFAGAIIGAMVWKWRRKQSVLAMCEVINSAFPLAWVFGRMGCATVHDHPGLPSDAWFAVRSCGPLIGRDLTSPLFGCWPYPAGGPTGRYDLGLYEMVLSIPLAIAFLWLWHRKPIRPVGFYTGWMCIAYAPVRFFLDFLRESEGGVTGGDPRYGGLTPAQWACFALLGVGIYFLRVASRGDTTGLDAPDAPAAEPPEGEEDDGEEAREAPPEEPHKPRKKRPAGDEPAGEPSK